MHVSLKILFKKKNLINFDLLVFPNKCWNPKTRKAYKVGEDFFLTRSCHKGTCRSDFSIGYVGYD